MKVYQISAITLKVRDMEKSCSLYSKIPGFRLTYGGKPSDRFTTFEIGKRSNATTYLNLELIEEVDHEGDYCSSSTADFNNNYNNKSNSGGKIKGSGNFGRIIFHTEDVDRLYSYMKNDEYISKCIVFENEPTNAPWGERFFHIREPNGYQLSFAQPLW
jgi:catechol 2,3-dioxygenase-like lactoylglutathione lyase family enzyme